MIYTESYQSIPSQYTLAEEREQERFERMCEAVAEHVPDDLQEQIADALEYEEGYFDDPGDGTWSCIINGVDYCEIMKLQKEAV